MARVFSAETKSFLGDIKVETEYSRIAQLACNPVDPIFMASVRPTNPKARDGCLVLLNVRTMKQQYVLRLEPEKVAMNALRFNHNGQLLVAGDVNGVVRVMGTCILFACFHGSNETQMSKRSTRSWNGRRMIARCSRSSSALTRRRCTALARMESWRSGASTG